ncbi:YfbU family protein [Pseudomonas fluorescens]|uniref:YfbU family protein n=1 Tax=Pseudomonas fluorescens TaxID=294 RepID=UPI00209A8068|nr:YfbU family protein [Pseudomonas fluorescens]MCO7626435.1 YfbU family protein [Pseudomonas fluorescens]
MTTLDKKDRILLINQYKILAALNIEERDRYLELIEILENGYSVFYSEIDYWVSEEMPSSEGKFVLEILDLYRAIEDLKRSTKEEKITNHRNSYFRGFDGNNETEYMSFCRFLVETQGKFQEQKNYLIKNDNMNSHMPMIPMYKRMLEKKSELGISFSMTIEQALQILET